MADPRDLEEAADVRKLLLEERAKRSAAEDKVKALEEHIEGCDVCKHCRPARQLAGLAQLAEEPKGP